jgi:hypothetical protein
LALGVVGISNLCWIANILKMSLFKKNQFPLDELHDGEHKVFFKADGEWCYLWTPPSFKVNDKIPIVISNHGAGGYVRKKDADWLRTESKIAFLRAIMEGATCAIAGSHACGDHWGNACAVNANAVLLKALDGCNGLDTNRLGLIGGGLGGTLVWNSVLGPFEGRVNLVAVLQAVANLKAIIIGQQFKEACLKAHGLPKNTPDDEAVAKIRPYDPMHKVNRLEKGTKLPRTAIYHGAKDIILPPEDHAIPLAEAIKTAGGAVDLNIFDEVEHNVYAMGRPMEEKLREFFSGL